MYFKVYFVQASLHNTQVDNYSNFANNISH